MAGDLTEFFKQHYESTLKYRSAIDSIIKKYENADNVKEEHLQSVLDISTLKVERDRSGKFLNFPSFGKSKVKKLSCLSKTGPRLDSNQNVTLPGSSDYFPEAEFEALKDISYCVASFLEDEEPEPSDADTLSSYSTCSDESSSSDALECSPKWDHDRLSQSDQVSSINNSFKASDKLEKEDEIDGDFNRNGYPPRDELRKKYNHSEKHESYSQTRMDETFTINSSPSLSPGFDKQHLKGRPLYRRIQTEYTPIKNVKNSLGLKDGVQKTHRPELCIDQTDNSEYTWRNSDDHCRLSNTKTKGLPSRVQKKGPFWESYNSIDKDSQEHETLRSFEHSVDETEFKHPLQLSARNPKIIKNIENVKSDRRPVNDMSLPYRKKYSGGQDQASSTPINHKHGITTLKDSPKLSAGNNISMNRSDSQHIDSGFSTLHEDPSNLESENTREQVSILSVKNVKTFNESFTENSSLFDVTIGMKSPDQLMHETSNKNEKIANWLNEVTVGKADIDPFSAEIITNQRSCENKKIWQNRLKHSLVNEARVEFVDVEHHKIPFSPSKQQHKVMSRSCQSVLRSPEEELNRSIEKQSYRQQVPQVVQDRPVIKKCVRRLNIAKTFQQLKNSNAGDLLMLDKHTINDKQGSKETRDSKKVSVSAKRCIAEIRNHVIDGQSSSAMSCDSEDIRFPSKCRKLQDSRRSPRDGSQLMARNCNKEIQGDVLCSPKSLRLRYTAREKSSNKGGNSSTIERDSCQTNQHLLMKSPKANKFLHEPYEPRSHNGSCRKNTFNDRCNHILKPNSKDEAYRSSQINALHLCQDVMPEYKESFEYSSDDFAQNNKKCRSYISADHLHYKEQVCKDDAYYIDQEKGPSSTERSNRGKLVHNKDKPVTYREKQMDYNDERDNELKDIYRTTSAHAFDYQEIYRGRPEYSRRNCKGNNDKVQKQGKHDDPNDGMGRADHFIDQELRTNQHVDKNCIKEHYLVKEYRTDYDTDRNTEYRTSYQTDRNKESRTHFHTDTDRESGTIYHTYRDKECEVNYHTRDKECGADEDCEDIYNTDRNKECGANYHTQRDKDSRKNYHIDRDNNCRTNYLTDRDREYRKNYTDRNEECRRNYSTNERGPSQVFIDREHRAQCHLDENGTRHYRDEKHTANRFMDETNGHHRNDSRTRHQGINDCCITDNLKEENWHFNGCQFSEEAQHQSSENVFNNMDEEIQEYCNADGGRNISSKSRMKKLIPPQIISEKSWQTSPSIHHHEHDIDSSWYNTHSETRSRQLRDYKESQSYRNESRKPRKSHFKNVNEERNFNEGEYSSCENDSFEDNADEFHVRLQESANDDRMGNQIADILLSQRGNAKQRASFKQSKKDVDKFLRRHEEVAGSHVDRKIESTEGRLKLNKHDLEKHETNLTGKDMWYDSARREPNFQSSRNSIGDFMSPEPQNQTRRHSKENLGSPSVRKENKVDVFSPSASMAQLKLNTPTSSRRHHMQNSGKKCSTSRREGVSNETEKEFIMQTERGKGQKSLVNGNDLSPVPRRTHLSEKLLIPSRVCGLSYATRDKEIKDDGNRNLATKLGNHRTGRKTEQMSDTTRDIEKEFEIDNGTHTGFISLEKLSKYTRRIKINQRQFMDTESDETENRNFCNAVVLGANDMDTISDNGTDEICLDVIKPYKQYYNKVLEKGDGHESEKENSKNTSNNSKFDTVNSPSNESREPRMKKSLFAMKVPGRQFENTPGSKMVNSTSPLKRNIRKSAKSPQTGKNILPRQIESKSRGHFQSRRSDDPLTNNRQRPHLQSTPVKKGSLLHLNETMSTILGSEETNNGEDEILLI